MTGGAIVLASGSTLLEVEIRESFQPPLNGELVRWDDALGAADTATRAGALLDGDPWVVAVGPDWPIADALAVSAAITDRRPEVAVVLIAELTSRLWEKALRAGVRGVVSPGASKAELRDAIDRARDLAGRARANLAVPAAGVTAKRGQLLCVLSPKGGSGKTMLATNLGVVFGAARPGAVALVDLDLQFGDVATALQLVPDRSMASLTTSSKAPDATAVKVLFTGHPSHLHVLCAPSSPVEAEEVSAERVGEALDVLVGEFPHTIVDTGAGLDEYSLAAIERATDLVLVCTTDVGSVRALRKELDVLDRLGMHTARRHVVLNRSDARVGLDVGDIEATLGLHIDAMVPSSRIVPTAMNRGVAVVESDPRSAVARAVVDFASRFVNPTPDTTPQPAPSRWRGRHGR